MTLYFYGKPKPEAKHCYHVIIMDGHEDVVYEFMFRSRKELTALQEYNRAEAEFQNIMKYIPSVCGIIPEEYELIVRKMEEQEK